MEEKFAAEKWQYDTGIIHNIILDRDTYYIIELSYVDDVNPEHPTLKFYSIAFVEDGEFFYAGKHDKEMKNQKILRFAKINN